jgi:Domain of unknown function (DUF4410)
MKTMKTNYKLNNVVALEGAFRMQACPTVSLRRQSSRAPSTLRRKLAIIVPCLFAMVLIVGCASTKVSNRQRLVYDVLPRPDHILVYNFTATPADVPADSALAGQSSEPATPPTEEEIALARELGTAIAAQLVTAIQEMGLPAVQVSTPITPQVNDIVIRGYLVSIETGSAAKRMTIGFGSGGSELTTVIEGYQMTATGLRKLGSGITGSKGSKGPGAALGAAGWIVTGSPIGLVVGGGMKIYGEASGSAKIEGRAKATAKEIADVLKQRFQEEGWIK